MSRKQYIEELRKKNAIKHMCEKWSDKGIFITEDEFLETETTSSIQEKILKKLDEMDDKKNCYIYSRNIDIISIYEEYLVKNIDMNEQYVFFSRDAQKIGGLILIGKTIIEKRKFLLNETELFEMGCTIFICTEDVKKGICLWKGEYDFMIYVW